MSEENNLGIIVSVVLIFAFLFFGGWYMFLGNGSQTNQQNVMSNYETATTSEESIDNLIRVDEPNNAEQPELLPTTTESF